MFVAVEIRAGQNESHRMCKPSPDQIRKPPESGGIIIKTDGLARRTAQFVDVPTYHAASRWPTRCLCSSGGERHFDSTALLGNISFGQFWYAGCPSSDIELTLFSLAQRVSS
jgi:hypothetical protein